MTRFASVAVLIAGGLLAGPVAADDAKPTFFLQPDGSVTARVQAVESEVATLRKEVASLKAQLAAQSGGRGITSPPTATVRTQRVQVCENGRCRIVEVPVTDSTPAACPNCTTCANGCQCFGGGYYCADGRCPVQFQSGQPAGYIGGNPAPVAAYSGGSCAGGTCAPQRSGWYPGKLLFGR